MAPAVTTASSTATTVSTPQKVVVGPLAGPVPTGTKVVLTTKVGSPATVTFQQNKNFHQTFATWVKQGQSSTGEQLFIVERTCAGVHSIYGTYISRIYSIITFLVIFALNSLAKSAGHF